MSHYIRCTKCGDDTLDVDTLCCSRECGYGWETTEVFRLRKEKAAAISALQALGVLPEGYCFCQENRDALKPDAKHVGECQEARAILAREDETRRRGTHEHRRGAIES